MRTNIREIPYNYTSFSDREIIVRLLGSEIWQILDQNLRQKIKTGNSARMLFAILGDMWVIRRNPYIQDDLLNNKKRRQQLYTSFNNKLNRILSNSEHNQDVNQLITAAQKYVSDFQTWLEQKDKLNKKIHHKLARTTNTKNICFDGFSKVSHVTDATDWRVEYPQVVITPNNEQEILKVVKACLGIKMSIIPRGGGTGYTGGVVPMVENTAVINTEKLHEIEPIKFVKINQQKVATITCGAGTITKQITDIANENNLIFAVDPTSQDSSTIGGNIATNAGGKKAVMWGTTLDNLLSWRMVMPDATWIEVTRENHNLSKIHDVPSVEFTVRKYTKNKTIKKYRLTLTREEIRKPGLGKDVTNKILGKLPGAQKEGCDGIITSATFVLHPKFNHIHTLCMEFFNPDLKQSVTAINQVIELIKPLPNVNLTGLEHLDARYIKAVGYSTKSSRSLTPKMLLIADISGDDINALKTTSKKIHTIITAHTGETFTATTPESRALFWSDRSKTAAIATHTNAFKINEDVVIPLEKLADYSEHIEKINIEQSRLNKLEIITAYQQTLNKTLTELKPDSEIGKIHVNKINSLLAHLADTHTKWQKISLDNQARSPIKKISLTQTVQNQIDEALSGSQWLELRQKLQKQRKTIHSRRIVVATHMHAGDGNVHTNIPVHSNDYEMLHRAEKVVDKIMQIAQDLGGVISGEHGIGLTKIKYLHPENIADFKKYKQEVDPDNVFNPDKLTNPSALKKAYTPSLRLLEIEALILEESELGEINSAVKDCLRCGKCKPVCTTHVPRANLLYSPRNKILATGLLTEAFLYEEQTKRGISSRHFSEFNDIADHCTICHRCFNPCPVDIDFGDVTILIRRLLKKQGKREFNLGSKVGMMFLNITDAKTINLVRNVMIRFGYFAQRFTGRFIKPTKKLPNTISTKSVKAQVVQFIKYPMPDNIPAKSMRAMLNIEDKNMVPVITKDKSNRDAVFYFPGCGSERLFSQIGLGTIKWLYELNITTVLPAGFLCCGYPQRANGDADHASKITTQNRVLLHRIAKVLNYLNINKMVVSCGTCYDQLLTYELTQIFPQIEIIDIHEILFEHGIKVESEDEQYLFHEPCHSPTKKHDGLKITQNLLQTDTKLADRCCGEAGTFAVARADIASQVKFKKITTIKDDMKKSPKAKKILTTCPACLQGLSRLEKEVGVKADYPILEMAKVKFGDNWQQNFVKEIEPKIDRVLL